MLNSLEFKNHKLLYGLVICAYLFIVLLKEILPNEYYYFFAVFISVASVLFALKKRVKIGVIPVLLMVRSLAMFINGYFLGVPFSILFGQELVTFLSVIVYVFAYNFSSNDKKEIRCIIIASTLLISFQLLESILRYGLDKNNIGAVVGMSNYAAAFLLIGITYLLFTKKDLFEMFVMIFAMIVFTLVQSMGAILALAVMFIIYAIKYVDWKNKMTYIVLFSIIGIGAIGIGVVLLTGIGHSVIDKIVIKFNALLEGDFNTFGSSRLSLYGFTWENIVKHPWFGNILNENLSYPPDYRWQNFRTHNFFFESMLKYGVFGTLINVAIIFVVVKKLGKNFKKNNYKFVCFLILIGAFIHGAVEPNFFTLDFSTFIWLIIGSMVSKENKTVRYKNFKQYNPIYRKLI